MASDNSYMLQEQCFLLSHGRWVPWWDPCVRPTLHVRGGSIDPKALKFFPMASPQLGQTQTTPNQAQLGNLIPHKTS